MKRLLSVLFLTLFLAAFVFSACADETGMKIVALKGPTAMGMVQMMDEAENGALKDKGYSFEIVSDIQLVTPMVVKGEVDVAAVPANIASVLYNNDGVDVQVLAVNTLGVLYIVESGDTVSSIEDLKGRTIYASGKGATPEYALNYILNANGIDPAKDVSIEWKSEHAECLNALIAEENAIAMLPQPFVTTAMIKAENLRVALDLNEEWLKAQEGNEAPSALITGSVIVRKAYAEAHHDELTAFMDAYAASVAYVNENVDAAAELVGKYDIVPAAVAKKAIPACNIVFIEGEELKSRLGGYLSELFAQNPKAVGGAVPADDFYFVR
ncbi:MAG: ABC transporter substrate-binding protein [Clostridia bacterium]|nr:ABC transporter substrate-binding protein [Clostridia bacterium]